MATNAKVAQSWAQGKSAKSNNMHTDGTTLWSYAMPIGHTQDGVKIAIRASVSVTTSQHMSLAGRYADIYVPAYDTTNNPSGEELTQPIYYGSYYYRHLRIPRLGVQYVFRVGKAYKTRRGAEKFAEKVCGSVVQEYGHYQVVQWCTW